MPEPGAAAATAMLKVTELPKTEGLGVCEVTVVIEASCTTTCVAALEVEGKKLTAPL